MAIAAVSPYTTWIDSRRDAHNIPAAICASMDFSPWPCAVAPVVTTILPEGPMRTEALSKGPRPVPRHSCTIRCHDSRPDARALFSARFEFAPPRQRERAALTFGIIAAVVDHPASVALAHFRGIRHARSRNEIAAAYLIARSDRVLRRSGRAILSITNVPCGRPAPRVGAAGVIFVRHSEAVISQAGRT